MKTLTRRALLSSAGGLLLVACKGRGAAPASCTDTAGLTPDEVQARTALGYVDRASAPDRPCVKCVQYIEPASDGACGGCKLLKGPIHPNGGCKAFAGKA